MFVLQKNISALKAYVESLNDGLAAVDDSGLSNVPRQWMQTVLDEVSELVRLCDVHKFDELQCPLVLTDEVLGADLLARVDALQDSVAVSIQQLMTCTRALLKHHRRQRLVAAGVEVTKDTLDADLTGVAESGPGILIAMRISLIHGLLRQIVVLEQMFEPLIAHFRAARIGNLALAKI